MDILKLSKTLQLPHEHQKMSVNQNEDIKSNHKKERPDSLVYNKHERKKKRRERKGIARCHILPPHLKRERIPL